MTDRFVMTWRLLGEGSNAERGRFFGANSDPKFLMLGVQTTKKPAGSQRVFLSETV
ncbi:MAG: hypothetical protein R3E42_08390 [Burkholderiaceae bacterium]